MIARCRRSAPRAVTLRETRAVRVRCDGCDPARPRDEHVARALLWLITAGAFELCDDDAPPPLDELSRAAGDSVFHTCRVFRATTGYTIHGFRRELRLHHALARILDGGEPLSEIAHATGFASQSHLTNRFRARFGITPARARTRDGRAALSDRRPAARPRPRA